MSCCKQARSQGGKGGATHPPNLPKGSLIATKWTKNGVFEGGLRGVRFKKSTFGGSRTTPKSILATGLVVNFKFPRNMEAPNFSGLGKLNQVLHALDIDGLEPVWTLKQSKQKISLHIIWFKTPASVKRTQETNGRVQAHQQASTDASLDAHAKPACIQTSAGTTSANITAKTKRKRKSPSTKKRDKDRLEKWRAKKKSCDESHLKSPHKFSSSVTVELWHKISSATPTSVF